MFRLTLPVVVFTFFLLGCSEKPSQEHTASSQTQTTAETTTADAKTVYMNFLDATYRKDTDAAISYFTESRRAQLIANKQAVEPLFNMLPKDVRITNEALNGTIVTMEGEGTAFYGKAAGQIQMVQENGNWKILKSEWNQAK